MSEPMEIKFHGHACFELSDGDVDVLVDPFLKPNNPVATVTAEEVEPTHLAISHGHADHIADAVPVARRTGAHCVALVEVANWLQGQGVEEVSDPNFGGTVEFDWGYVSIVPAWHTNTIPGSDEHPFSAEHGTVVGPAAGLLIKIGETTVYHAGDTCLFGDMRLIGERSDVDVALLPIGGHYTMDRRDAVIAAEFVGAATVIPMHFNTFPPVETDAGAFKEEVESKTSSKVVVLEPGESVEV
jgi:L-ascorbate metabolism protein UlaG (beta-lactamase superfamily)